MFPSLSRLPHLYPLWQLSPLVLPCEPLVREDHDSIVRLSPERPPHALCGVAHRVERQEVVLPYAEGVT